MKRIIDVPEEGVNACKLWVEMGVASWQDKVIANSIPYVEPKQGKWIKIFENPFTNGYVCPFCGHKIQVTEQFLPQVTECEVCGADMRGEEE